VDYVVDVMISVLATNAEDRGVESRPGRVKLKTITFIFATSPLSTLHGVLRANQDNVSE